VIRITESVVITLRRTPDRERAFVRWLHAHPLPAGVPRPEVVLGADARHIPGFGHAIGCAMSHAGVLYRFACKPGAPDDWLVVFEDDARWGPTLPEYWPEISAAVPADAEILFVGGDVWRKGGRGERLGPRLTRAAGVVRLHCYAVRRSSAVKVADIVSSQPGEHCDRLIAYASERGELSVVAADPFVCAQRADAVTWYAWNPDEPGTTDAGLEAWTRDVLGRGSRPPPAGRASAQTSGLQRTLALIANPCAHRGKDPIRQGCAGKLYRCGLYRVAVSDQPCIDAARVCTACGEHTHLANLSPGRQ
jgi:hypothetical protein